VTCEQAAGRLYPAACSQVQQLRRSAIAGTRRRPAIWVYSAWEPDQSLLALPQPRMDSSGSAVQEGGGNATAGVRLSSE
jgi:hypothetical protein